MLSQPMSQVGACKPWPGDCLGVGMSMGGLEPIREYAMDRTGPLNLRPHVASRGVMRDHGRGGGHVICTANTEHSACCRCPVSDSVCDVRGLRAEGQLILYV